MALKGVVWLSLLLGDVESNDGMWCVGSSMSVLTGRVGVELSTWPAVVVVEEDIATRCDA